MRYEVIVLAFNLLTVTQLHAHTIVNLACFFWSLFWAGKVGSLLGKTWHLLFHVSDLDVLLSRSHLQLYIFCFVLSKYLNKVQGLL